MIKRKDLVDVGDENYNKRQGEFMLCRECENEIGGTRGDFFMVDMNYIFKCGECKSKNLVLVKADRVLRRVR